MKLRLKNWLFLVLAFMAFFYLFTLFSYIGISDYIESGIIKDYFASGAWHIEILFGGVLFGTLFLLIEWITENRFFRMRSFAFNIILKSALYILSTALVFVIIFYSFKALGIIGPELIASINDLLSIKLIISFFVYCLLFILLINLVIAVRQKFGPEHLFDLLTGKYYHPRTDELVFLFIDLQGSTRIAEKLGHTDYSRFIKECVHELTPVILNYKARVYQYVGDEVVLYWNKKEGIDQGNCIESFFAYSEVLKGREDYFNSKYGEVPKFKAGMDIGKVTLTEIGDVKREIAFHGDVLNTASRLEKKCNEFGSPIIVSEHIVAALGGESKYQFEFLSDLPLRGKSQNLKFYSVSA